MRNDAISLDDATAGVANAVVVEYYPDYFKGPAILLLQRDCSGEPIHILWGVPLGKDHPAVLVTAYRPSPAKWKTDLVTRRQS